MEIKPCVCVKEIERERERRGRVKKIEPIDL